MQPLHGAALVELVIDRVREQGMAALGLGSSAGPPKGLSAQRLAGLRLPDDRPLSPAMRTWLAFDGDWLGWLSARQRKIQGQTVGQWTEAEYGEDLGFGAFDAIVGAKVLPLHHGADSRRCLLLGEADSSGEYPVLLADIDDEFYLGVEYPGLDVYLADLVGLVEPPYMQYGAYADHPVYGPRMHEHANRLFGGAIGLDLMTIGGFGTGAMPDDGATDEDDSADMVEVVLGRNPKTGAELTKWVRRDQVRPGQRTKE